MHPQRLRRTVMMSTRNSFMTSRKALKAVGHGMSYTLLAEAMICTIEMPT
jgi:hypothetical protein